MQTELGDEETVHQADDCADGDDDQHGCQNPPDIHGGQEAEHLIGKVRFLQEHTGEGGGEANHAAGRQVRTGENDTAADAQGQGQVGRDLGNQVRQGAQTQKVGALNGGIDNEDQHQDIKRVIEDAVRDCTLFILRIQLFEFLCGIAQGGNGICHFPFPP